jgi:hypothetical protein
VQRLNKGESLHAPRRDLHYAHQGSITKAYLADQTIQAWCLTVPTNAVITWTTEYYQLAVQHPRPAAGTCPTRSSPTSARPAPRSVNFFGVISVDMALSSSA